MRITTYTPAEIVEQHRACLINRIEARVTLDAMKRQADFNACYADHPDSYKRYTRLAAAAERALAVIR